MESSSIVELFSFLVSGFGAKRGERVNKKGRERERGVRSITKRNFRNDLWTREREVGQRSFSGLT